ncbi:MAG: L-2-amino-thiazoline-4-carboxylic acid hydrolase [Filifactoraceae bacterium]
MKYKVGHWIVLKPFIRGYLSKNFDKYTIKIIFKKAKEEYRLLLSKADDIGSDNPMASNLYFSLLFFSFLNSNRDLISKDMLRDMMKSIIESPFIKAIKGMDLNNEKGMKKFKRAIIRRAQWAEKHKNSYPETWEFNFDDKHKDGCYYYFTKCPIDKFFKDNDFEEYTHIFCELDYLTIGSRQGKLIREGTLANGDDKCDFWIVGDKMGSRK